MDVHRFGAFIQSRRKDLNMTQGELGAKLNVTDKAISRWERGVGFPDIKLLEPLAEALQISIQELMQCEQIKPKENAVEMPHEVMETTQETKKEPWLGKYRRIFAVLCFLIYTMFYALSRNPQLAEHQVWISPLNRLFFIVSVFAFLYASYQEVNNG